MAQRRMFAKTIIDSDAFLDMPLSTQALYFHLSMRADDDGFLNNAKKISRMIGASKNDFDLLLMKNFIIPFENGICVIKHWRIHNYIRNDRYKPTVYQEELNKLVVKDNKAYSFEAKLIEDNNETEELETPEDIRDNEGGIPNVHQMETQVRLGKDRLELGKDRLGKVNNSISKDILVPKSLVPIANAWNSLNLSKIKSIKDNRLKMLNARIKEYGIETVIETIKSIEKSSFLKGQNNRNWIITFNWLIKPNNFTKVLEGNYLDKEGESNAGNPREVNESSQTKKPDFSCFE
ncbi:hypothetical protein [Clostridium sp. Ade.TY]|uniref:hypothetical protein n=1 Tax=Clostridium sp. Ade.TY TaxID=1391647 RepID=UPI00040EF720|nr:hypothetical protein [Clostridium sp. Ade.TY]